ncbi:MAG: hypothetical protein JWL77_779 [Chthonomonadaceae bacterium]|nr:hypothetical protein [Chthonomonadaceae bacterium]
MSMPLLELEGTVEEIRESLAAFAGQRLHITIRPIETPAGATPEVTPRKHSITDKLLAMAEEMPAEERAKMPIDLAEQHDHYLYGWPKK